MSLMIGNKVGQYSTLLAVSLHKPQRITMKHNVQSCKVFAGRYYVFVQWISTFTHTYASTLQRLLGTYTRIHEAIFRIDLELHTATATRKS